MADVSRFGGLSASARSRARTAARPEGSERASEAAFDASVALMLEGDEEAFRQVYRAIHPGLLRYLSVLVGAAEAEDVASETWAQAFRDLDKFTGDGDGFRGWVSTIARHRALDFHRARARRPVIDSPIEDLPDRAAGPDAESAAWESISTQEALALISSLPREQAEAVLLRAVMGLDAKAAGRVVGRRPGAIRTAAYRGLRTLAARSDISPGSGAEEVR